MKISLKYFIIICFMVLFPFVSNAGGPGGYVKTLDPIIKNEIIESLRQVGLFRGTKDDEIEMAITEYLFRYESLLRTPVPLIPPHKVVDTFICLMMYNKYRKFERYMEYNRCKEFIRIP